MRAKSWGVVLMVAVAWVLWVKMTKNGTEWDVVSGHLDFKVCESKKYWQKKRMMALEGAIERRIQGKGLNRKLDSDEIYLTKDTNRYRAGTYFRFVCLPHAVDPRPRK